MRDPTINAHPRVVAEEVVTSKVARARVVVEAVADPPRTRYQELAGARSPFEGKSSQRGGVGVGGRRIIISPLLLKTISVQTPVSRVGFGK